MSRYTILNSSDRTMLHTFCTNDVLPMRRGEMSTVFTPWRKFDTRRSVSFMRSVKFSPDVATPKMNGLLFINELYLVGIQLQMLVIFLLLTSLLLTKLLQSFSRLGEVIDRAVIG